MSKICGRIVTGILLSVFLIPSPAFPEMMTFTKEYAYQASDADSKLTSRAIALDQAKKLILQEIGVYVEGEFSDVSDENKSSVKEDITTITAGVATASLVDERWDGKNYWLKAEIKADPSEVAKAVKRLRNNRQKTRELAKSQIELESAKKKIGRLEEEMGDGNSSLQRMEKFERGADGLSANDWLQKGEAYESSNQPAEALFAYGRAIGLDPVFARAFNHRGKVYARLKKFQLASEDFDKAVKLDPQNPEFVVSRGELFASKGENQKSLDDFTVALKLNADKADYYTERGRLYLLEIGDANKALVDLEEAVKLDPGSARALYYRGRVFLSLGKNDKAIEDIGKAITINPSYEEARIVRGTENARAKNFFDALDDFNEIVRQNPGSKEGYYGLGLTYMSKGDDEIGVGYLKRSAHLGYDLAMKLLSERKIKW